LEYGNYLPFSVCLNENGRLIAIMVANDYDNDHYTGKGKDPNSLG
jgi:hypothetical protein